VIAATGAVQQAVDEITAVVMELRQLEYFVAVAEESNFTRAAERVHISQSGISAQVRRLEEGEDVHNHDGAPRRRS
jgi:hypothetical protein